MEYQDWAIETARKWLVRAYGTSETGDDFGSLLCHELHVNQLDFRRLAAKWHITLPHLGELIEDHCRRL